MSEGTKMIVGGLAVLWGIVFCSWLLTVLEAWPELPELPRLPGWAWFLWLVIIGAPVTVGAFWIWDAIRNR
jgi:hypothetical protein